MSDYQDMQNETKSRNSAQLSRSLSRNSSSALTNLLNIASPTKAASSAMGHLGQLLPGPLVNSLSVRSRRGTSPPPILVCVRFADENKQEAYVAVRQGLSLMQLRCLIHKQAGILPEMQRLFVEEDRPSSASASPPSFFQSLRWSAGYWSSRDRIREALINGINFLFLPEAINREVRGNGIISWTRQNIMTHLQGPPSPRIAQATVVLYGRRSFIELSATATVHRLREETERQVGLAYERQRIVVCEMPKQHLGTRLFWIVMRLFFSITCIVFDAAASWMKWLCGLEPPQVMRLQLLQTEKPGNSIYMDVRQDLTLGQLQHMLQLQHGDGLEVETLVLSSRQGMLSLR